MSTVLQIKRGVFANMPTLATGELYYATDTGKLYVGPTPTLIGPSSGSSSGAQGTATLDFGSFPGASDASIAVTGQSGILSNSCIQAWISPATTTDHSADEHIAETLDIRAGNIVAGTGFTIYGISRAFVGLESPRIYGKWNVAWKWS